MTRVKSLQKKRSSTFEGSSPHILTQVEIHISEDKSDSQVSPTPRPSQDSISLSKSRLACNPPLASISAVAEQQQQMPKFQILRESSVDKESAETTSLNCPKEKLNTFLSVSQNDLSLKSQFRITRKKNSYGLSPDNSTARSDAEASPLSWSSSLRTSASDSDMERCSGE